MSNTLSFNFFFYLLSVFAFGIVSFIALFILIFKTGDFFAAWHSDFVCFLAFGGFVIAVAAWLFVVMNVGFWISDIFGY